MPLFMFLIMTTRNVDLALEEFYGFMFLFLMIGVLYYYAELILSKLGTNEKVRPEERVFRVGEYQFGGAPYQIVAGVVVGLALTSPLMLFGNFRALADPIGEFVTQAVFVAFVETLLMVVMVRKLFLRVPVRVRTARSRSPRTWFEWRVVPIGVVLWPLVFGFLHPPVRLPWLAGEFTLESLAAFAWGAAWGVVFYLLFWMRDAGGLYNLFFGAVTAWSAHIAANLVILTYRTQVLGFEFFPVEVADVTDIVPLTLLAVALILLLIRLLPDALRRSPT